MQSYGRRRYRAIFKHLVALDLSDGAGQGSLFLQSVTYHNHIVQHIGVFVKGYLEIVSFGPFDDLWLEPDIRHLDDSIGIVESKFAIQVGHCTILCSFHSNGSSNDGVTVGICHNAL